MQTYISESAVLDEEDDLNRQDKEEVIGSQKIVNNGYDENWSKEILR